MFCFHNDILCIESTGIYPKLTSYDNYKQLSVRKKLRVVQRGGNGRKALVEYESLPQKYKDIIEATYGNPHEKVKHYHFENEIKPDGKATTFYANYKLNDGRNLPEKAQLEYRTNARVLNAVDKLANDRRARRRALGSSTKGVWEGVCKCVVSLDKSKWPHTLPSNPRRLKQKLKDYKEQGYTSLIHRGYCNDNSRKVNNEIESLILSLYCLPNKPFGTTVHDLYLRFLGGSEDIYDVNSGELFNREDFFKDGMPIIISEATVWNYINNPKTQVLLSKVRSNGSAYKGKYEPHHHRHRPEYSLSKISMDDRDIPHKMADGNRVKAYYAFDVASEVVVGYAHSHSKDEALFIGCVRNMFELLDKHRLGVPMEVEVEHHLVNNFKDGLMKEGNLFEHIRWCNPGNSQEKHAERLIGVKKYKYEKDAQVGIGRHYLKNDTNVPKVQQVWDEKGRRVKAKVFTYDEIVANDVATIHAMNNDLHSNQKKYKGMTRMEVFLQHVYPDLARRQRNQIVRWIGECTNTSILRSQYVTVQYQKYQLPSVHILDRLKPNNLNVKAYWVPNAQGRIEEVHLYQNDEYICTCEQIRTHSTSKAESTEMDQEAFVANASYVAQHRAMVKEGIEEKIRKVRRLDVVAEEVQEEPVEVLDIRPDSPIEESWDFDDDIDYEKRALESL